MAITRYPLIYRIGLIHSGSQIEAILSGVQLLEQQEEMY